MTSFAHILSASYIGVYSANVLPSETSLIAISVISASALDLDHIYYLIKDHKFFKKYGYKHNLHKARSVLHELIGFTIISGIGLLLSFIDIKLAKVVAIPALIHIVEDMIVGVSTPFRPIDKTEIHLLSQKISVKVIIDVTIILVFLFLWIQYLSAAK